MATIATAPIKKQRTWLRWLKRIAVGALVLVLLVLVFLVTREWFAARSDAKRFPQQGRLVDVGGFRMNIDCTGPSAPGTPTVILESGAGVPGYGWSLVQREIAKTARVCSYDRAGYGWSEAPLENHRTSLQMAKELHSLLQNAGVAPPYVLVGHSLGGYNIRLFNKEYPSEVAGAVFVDSSHEDQAERMSPALKKLFDDQVNASPWTERMMLAALHTGIYRRMQQQEGWQKSLPADYVEEVEYLQRSSRFIHVELAEMRSFPESARQVRDSGNFGDKPIVVLTAGKAFDVPGFPKKDFEDFQRVWISELQPRLAQLSTKGKQVLVPDSTHMIPMERPSRVVEAVEEVLRETTGGLR